MEVGAVFLTVLSCIFSACPESDHHQLLARNGVAYLDFSHRFILIQDLYMRLLKEQIEWFPKKDYKDY